MTTQTKAVFQRLYQQHLQHLTLKGLQPKTIDAYARGVRRIGDYFNYDITNLTEQQLIFNAHGN